MLRSLRIGRDRALSAVAICLCAVGVSVAASALESSLTTGMAPNPPRNAPESGLSILALLYLLLNSILSLFGISLSWEASTLPGTANPIRGVIALLQLVHRYRSVLLVGLVVVTVLGLALKHRQRIGPTNVFTPPDPTVQSEPRPADWVVASPSNAVARAWIEMVRNVEVDDPHSRTLREWETAAIESGFDPVAVRTITETFADVRYGTADVTQERQRRIQEALTELTEHEVIGA